VSDPRIVLPGQQDPVAPDVGQQDPAVPDVARHPRCILSPIQPAARRPRVARKCTEHTPAMGWSRLLPPPSVTSEVWVQADGGGGIRLACRCGQSHRWDSPV